MCWLTFIGKALVVRYDMAGLMRSCTLKQLEASKLFECELIKQRTAEQSKKVNVLLSYEPITDMF